MPIPEMLAGILHNADYIYSDIPSPHRDNIHLPRGLFQQALKSRQGSEQQRETQLQGVIYRRNSGAVLLLLPLQGDRPRFIHLSRPGVGRQRP